jgi:hypothetical protein
MKTAAKISALVMFVGLMSFSTLAAAQYAPPPPPPPPPSAGPEAEPPPAANPVPPPASPHVAPPTTAPAPYPAPGRCGVPQAPPCYRPAPRYRRPARFWRVGLYLGAGGGGFGILGAKGPYEHISAGGMANLWVGLYLSRRFALELGFMGSIHQEQFTEYDGTYWGENEMMLWGVTLDAKFNLVTPGWRRRFVPYLQAGVGAYGLVGDTYDEYGYVGSQSLATGAGVQLGGGLDIYLTRWLVLGGRLLYRGIVLGKMNCGDTTDRCTADAEDSSTVLHGLTGEINMSIIF